MLSRLTKSISQSISQWTNKYVVFTMHQWKNADVIFTLGGNTSNYKPLITAIDNVVSLVFLLVSK